MTNYSKAFLSHSSKDKGLVEKVASLINAARWELDKFTFDEGATNAEAIFQSMQRSDLFVLFASGASVESPWVRAELRIAQELLYSGKIGGVLAFLIDDTDVSKLPDWLRMHVYARTKSDVRIANRIREKLTQLDALRSSPRKPFVARNRLRDEIEKRLSDIDNPAGAIYVSGVGGIGRRALVAQSLETLFPSADIAGLEVSLSDGEGPLELYRKLHFSLNNPTLSEANAFFASTSKLSAAELIQNILEIVETIAKTKGFVWIQSEFLAGDGQQSIDPTLSSLLIDLKSKRPTVIVRARRSPKFADQTRLKNVAFFRVESLTEEESRRLWTYALDYYKVTDADERFIATLLSHLSGHPGMIWMAAEYVARLGKAAIQATPRELIDALRALSFAVIDGIPLGLLPEKILALFDEYSVIAPSDLLAICGESDQDVSKAISELVSYGLVESEGEHLRMAAFLQHARFRRKFSANVDGFVVDARKRLLELTRDYTGEDNVSFATIDAAIVSAIKKGNSLPLAFDERALVGSHFLRVARSYYDREKYDETIRFCRSALTKKDTLTQGAQLEAYRLLGMAAVRTAERKTVDEALEGLKRLGPGAAKRHVHFIVGFDSRWNGNFELAESEFREVLALDSKDLHALRELAQLLVAREAFKEAERYAREAHSRAPDNPFQIDILLQCLIEQRRSNRLLKFVQKR
jgi:tetratricopeptide (TPR) repeat protein